MFPAIAVVTNWSLNLVSRDQDQCKKIKSWKDQDQDHQLKITSSDVDHAKDWDQLGDLDLLDQDQCFFCISDGIMPIMRSAGSDWSDLQTMSLTSKDD